MIKRCFALLIMSMLLLSLSAASADSLPVYGLKSFYYTGELVHPATQAANLLVKEYDYLTQAYIPDGGVMQSESTENNGQITQTYSLSNARLTLHGAPGAFFEYHPGKYMDALMAACPEIDDLHTVLGLYSQEELSFMSVNQAAEEAIAWIQRHTGITCALEYSVSIVRPQYEARAESMGVAEPFQWPEESICYVLYLNQIMDSLPVYRSERFCSDSASNYYDWIRGTDVCFVRFWDGTFYCRIKGGYELIERGEMQEYPYTTKANADTWISEYYRNSQYAGTAFPTNDAVSMATVDRISMEYLPWYHSKDADGAPVYELRPFYIYRIPSQQSGAYGAIQQYSNYFVVMKFQFNYRVFPEMRRE